MYAVRVYKDYNTNKIDMIRIVNSDTLQFKDYSVKELKTILKYDKSAIKNLSLDMYGNIKLIGGNPNKKVNYYKEVYQGKYKIRLYCVITGYNQSVLHYIADTYDGNIIKGSDATIGEIATALQVNIDDLKFFNGVLSKRNDKYECFIFKGNNSYYKLPNLQVDSINNIFGNEWNVEIQDMTQEGVRLNYIEPSKPTGWGKIPEGVSHIEEFGCEINHLELPDSLLTLGESCFEDNEDLISVKLGRGLKTVPYCCFTNSRIKDIKFSGYEQNIEECAFDECCYLKGSIITNARVIGKRAFCSTAINKVKLLRVKKIECEAFAYNDKLESVELGEELKVIMGGAFRDCTKLSEVTLPPTVKLVGKKAFNGCSRLKTVKLSADTEIREDSFPKRTKLIYY